MDSADTPVSNTPIKLSNTLSSDNSSSASKLHDASKTQLIALLTKQMQKLKALDSQHIVVVSERDLYKSQLIELTERVASIDANSTNSNQASDHTQYQYDITELTRRIAVMNTEYKQSNELVHALQSTLNKEQQLRVSSEKLHAESKLLVIQLQDQYDKIIQQQVAETQQYKSKLAELQQSNELLNKQLHSALSRADEQSNQISHLQQQYEQLQSRYDELNQQYRHANHRINELEQNVADDSIQCKHQLSQRDIELSELQSSVESITAQYKQLQSTHDSCHHSLEQLKSQHNSTIDELNSQLSHQQQHNTQLQSAHDTLQHTLQSTQSSNTDITNQLQVTQAKLHELQQTIDESVSASGHTSQDELSHLQQQYEQLQSRYDELNQQYRHANHRINELEQNVADDSARYVELEKQLIDTHNTQLQQQYTINRELLSLSQHKQVELDQLGDEAEKLHTQIESQTRLLTDKDNEITKLNHELVVLTQQHNGEPTHELQQLNTQFTVLQTELTDIIDTVNTSTKLLQAHFNHVNNSSTTQLTTDNSTSHSLMQLIQQLIDAHNQSESAVMHYQQHVKQLSDELSTSKNEVSLLNEAVAASAARNELLDGKLQKMKQLLVRANKYIDDNKLKSSTTSTDIDTIKQKVRDLQSIISDRWTTTQLCIDHQINNTTNDTLQSCNTKIDDTSIDVNQCQVVKRIQINGIMWCLCETINNQQSFWTKQDVYIRKKLLKHSSSSVHRNDNANMHSSEINNGVINYNDNCDNIILYDNTVLPATIDREIRIDLHDKFTHQFTHSQQIARQEILELKQNIIVLNDKLSDASQEYQRYRSNAQQLLHQQQSELQQSQQQSIHLAQLQSNYDQLQHQYNQLAAVQKLHDPAQIDVLNNELTLQRTQQQQLLAQLHGSELKYKQKLEQADITLADERRQNQHKITQLNKELADIRGNMLDELQVERDKCHSWLAGKDDEIENLHHRIQQLQQHADEIITIHSNDNNSFNDYIAATSSNHTNHISELHTPQLNHHTQISHQQLYINDLSVYDIDSRHVADKLTDSAHNRSVNLNDSAPLQNQIRKLHEMLVQTDLRLQHSRANESRLNERMSEVQRELSTIKELGSNGNIQYLKAVMTKYMQTTRQSEHEQLFPVLCTLLRLAPDEISDINDKRKASTNAATKLLSNLF